MESFLEVADVGDSSVADAGVAFFCRGLLLVMEAILRLVCGWGLEVPFLGREVVVFQGELSLWLGKGFGPMVPLWSLFISGPQPVGAGSSWWWCCLPGAGRFESDQCGLRYFLRILEDHYGRERLSGF